MFEKRPSPETGNNKEPRKKMVATALAGALALGTLGTVVAIAKHESGAGKEIVTSDGEAEARAQLMKQVATPEVGNHLLIAKGVSVDLLTGATVSNEQGAVSQLVKPMEKILNPAWVPSVQAEPTELCFTSGQNQATCFDIVQNKDYIVIRQEKQDSDGGFQSVEVESIKFQDATNVEVTDLDNGYAYSEELHQLIAAVPSEVLGPPPTPVA